MPPPRIAFVTTADWYFLSHRLPLARAARDAGFDVTVIAGEERALGARIEREGIRFIPLPISRGSTRITTELATVRALYRIYRTSTPDLVHHIALKPVIYGTIAARMAGVRCIVNAIAGQGYLSAARGRRARVARGMFHALLRAALHRRGTKTIFQNPDDLSEYVARGIVRLADAVLIRGSGVDLDVFVPAPEPAGVPIVLFASRLLWSKGVGALVDARRLLAARGVACRLVVVGIPDDANPDAVPEAQLRAWQHEGIAEWWGLRDDMPQVLRDASIVCLPTVYGEGIPKVLLEAAATGRPIVATDMPGCREIVQHGANGLLVPPRNAGALADALAQLLGDRPLREKMGCAGRALAEREFGEQAVVSATMTVYRQLLDSHAHGGA